MKAKGFFRALVPSMILSIAGLGFYGYSTKCREKESVTLKRYKKYYGVTSEWLSQLLSDKDIIKDYLKEFGYKKVAIYGMGSIAELLTKQFERYSDCEIKYYIDRNGREIFYGLNGLEVIDIDGIAKMEKVDVIIVTAVADYNEILAEIRKKIKNIKVISLEEIVNGN